MKYVFVALAFVLPAILLLLALATGGAFWLVLAPIVQYAGLLAERWFFFAQARHPQNLYYQVVS
jgi:DMSO reductase anchor subunit